MARLPLELGIPRFKESEEKVDIFANGDEDAFYMTADGKQVPSLLNFYKQVKSDLSVLGAGSQVAPPASATSQGRQNQWAMTATHLYVCVATNTWRRVALSSW